MAYKIYKIFGTQKECVGEEPTMPDAREFERRFRAEHRFFGRLFFLDEADAGDA